MVRRMKSELELRWDGSRRFAKRCVKHLEVPYTDAERRGHQALQEYARLRVSSAATEGQRFATEFVLKLLKKRLFSSPAAFATTLEKHARSVAATQGVSAGTSWQRQLDDADNDSGDDEENENNSLEALETASRQVAALAVEEKALLTELRGFATDAATRADSKARTLIQWLKKMLKPDGQWSNHRVILFTEYRAPQE